MAIRITNSVPVPVPVLRPVPVPIPELVIPIRELLSSEFYVERVKALNIDLKTGEKFTKVRACLGIVELAFSVGIPLSELPEMTQQLLSLLDQGIVLARSAAWALYWLDGGNESGRQNASLAWQPTDDQIQAMRTVLMGDERDPTIIGFLLAILHGGYRKRALLTDTEQKAIALKLACQLYPAPALAATANVALNWLDKKWASEALIEQLKTEDSKLREQTIATLKELELWDSVREQRPEAFAELIETPEPATR